MKYNSTYFSWKNVNTQYSIVNYRYNAVQQIFRNYSPATESEGYHSFDF